LIADPRFSGDVVAKLVCAAYLLASLIYGKAININPVVWLRGFIIADRKADASYFWGNVICVSLLFMVACGWAVDLLILQ
jgi:hypothetical protein